MKLRHQIKSTQTSKLFFACLLFSVSNTFGQTPNLGACEPFAIFSAVGAIDNVGPTFIYGDVGTNAGAFNGFPPGTVNGTIHVADVVSAQAAIDVEILYDYFSQLSCGSTISENLGNNQRLMANVFCIEMASTLSDTLILDGGNDANSMFIFKINGAFTTSVYSVILLENMAQAKNVFWQINGLFSLGDFSEFKGTIITDGANSLLSNSVIEGRILSRAGAISLASNEVIMNFSDFSLPVELLSFSVECQHHSALIKWSTASELNNDYFTIESSVNGKDWKSIYKVSGMGNSTSLQEYSFLFEDLERERQQFFRLKQTDFNGEYRMGISQFFKYCDERLLNLSLFPNPAKNTLHIAYNEEKDALISVTFFHSSGQKRLNFSTYPHEIDISGLENGMYLIVLEFLKEVVTRKVVIHHQ
jgi:hypothetical protein